MPKQVKNRLLNDWIGSCIEYAKETEPPKLFKHWAAIAAISSALERKCYMDWGIEGYLYPNMFIILCGPSAARKGTAMKKVNRLMAPLCKEDKIIKAPDACSMEKLINIMAKGVKGEEGSKHCSILVYATELTVFIDKKSEKMLSALNKLFDCEDKFDYSTKHQGEDFVKNVYMTLFGATTPSHIHNDFPQISTAGGFTSRVMFVFGDKKDKKVPLPVTSPELVRLEKQLIHDLAVINQLEGPFTMTPEYLDAYEAWYMDSDNNHSLEGHQFDGYVGRRGDHIRKLSMICSASRTNDMIITLEDFENARDLLYRTEEYLPFVFSGHGRCHGSHIIDAIWTKAKDLKGEWVKISDLYKRFIYDATWKEMEEYADVFKHVEEFEYRRNADDNFRPEVRAKKEFLKKTKG